MTGSHPIRQARHDLNVKPFIVIWGVTQSRPLAHRADAQPEPAPGQLTTEQGFALLDSLATYERPRPLVVLAGEDPFERRDLADLIRHGTNLGLNISLSPSVTPRLTRARLVELRAAGGTALSLSLDGASGETHDNRRGSAGTFEQTIKMARVVTDVGYRLQINSTLTAGNVHEAPALLARVIGLGARLWSVFFLVSTGPGSTEGALTTEEREDVLNWLHDISDRVDIGTTEAPQYRRVVLQRSQGRTYEGGDLYRFLTKETTRMLGGRPAAPRKPRPTIAVNAGSGLVFIDHLGDVYPDEYLPLRCGNVKDQPLPEIYAQSPVFLSLRDPNTWTGKCAVCEFSAVCGGSRSTAYSVTGDPLSSDPTCPYVPEKWRFPESDAQPV